MIELVIVLTCLVINALFSCFEMAFVTVSKPVIRQHIRKGHTSAQQLLKIRQNPERTLSVIQIGITLVGIISAAAGGAGAEEAFSPYLRSEWGLSKHTAEVVAITLVVIPLTFLNVIIGELVPKALALRNPFLIASWGVRLIGIVETVFSPLVWILEKLTKAILSLIPKSAATTTESLGTVDIDHLSTQTQQYVLNLVGTEQRKVHDVMIPWDKVDFIEESMSRDEITTLALRSGHTRLPVIKNQEVIGLLHTKEFIATLATGIEDWKNIVRPIIHVDHLALALKTLRLMQTQKSHMALVLKDAQPFGIVTFEDILEEIVGDFYDEDDDGALKKLLSNPAQRRWRPWKF